MLESKRQKELDQQVSIHLKAGWTVGERGESYVVFFVGRVWGCLKRRRVRLDVDDSGVSHFTGVDKVIKRHTPSRFFSFNIAFHLIVSTCAIAGVVLAILNDLSVASRAVVGGAAVGSVGLLMHVIYAKWREPRERQALRVEIRKWGR